MPESKVEAVYSVRSHIASTGVVPRSRATELLGAISEFGLVLRRGRRLYGAGQDLSDAACDGRASYSMAMRGASMRRERHRDKVFDRDRLACQI